MPSESASAAGEPLRPVSNFPTDGGPTPGQSFHGGVQPRYEAQRGADDARFRALVEHGSDLIAIVDSGGIVRYASPSHERVLGRSPASIVGGPVNDLVHPDDADEARRLYVEARPGRISTLRLRHADGSWRILAMTFTDLRADPAVGGIIVNSRDVTAERELEAQLRQAQQMEALGQLAGGVAHDFNNVLAAVEGFARLLHDDLPEGDARRTDAAEILRAAARGAAVARQLLAFSRRRALETELLDLAALARSAGDRLRATLPGRIAVVLLPEESDQPVHVLADRGQLDQVLTNLTTNASEAMADGGELTIEVHAEHDTVAPMAVMSVRDTGAGMDADVRARAFEPFFTTKAVGEGNGLGLATVYGLVHQFGGTVTVESAPGEGTVVTVRLPLVEAARRPSAPVGDDEAGVDGDGCTVLLVDDEESVRVVTRRMLERRGYSVLEASHGAAALATLASGVQVDLVLTDASMPVMGGRELSARLAREWPALPVVLMSGYTELVTDDEPVPLAAFLGKPFPAERLAATLARARQPRR